MRIARWRRVRSRALLSIGLACAAGLLAQSLPSEQGWPLAWLVPALLLLPARSRSSAAAAAIFGGGIGALALTLGWWLPWTMIRRFGAEPQAAALVWLLGAACHVPAAVLLGALSRWLSPASPLYPVGVGLGWGAMELSWETTWPGLPSWTVLGATQIDTPLAPLAGFIGVYGVSALVAGASAALLQAVLRTRHAVTHAIAAVLVAAGASWAAAPRTSSGVEPGVERLALIQPGTAIPGSGESSSYQRELLAVLLAETRALRAPVRFVLWPEGALLEPLGDRPDLLREIQGLVDERGFSLVLGAERRDAARRHVSVWLLEPRKTPRALYDKQQLVPFAEAWPVWAPRSLRRRLGSLAPVRPPAPGDKRAAALPFELSLCWESAFSVPRGPAESGTLVNLANDGWYDDLPALGQALRMARWRALERGAWLLRVATSGISALVSPQGEIVASLGPRQRGVLLATLVPRSAETLFERAGYTPLCLSLLLTAVARVALG